jgi:hypothetical protein
MTAIPTTRYVRSDDVHVAYQVIGDGPLTRLALSEQTDRLRVCPLL